MATRNIVPRADGEGSIGTLLKKWGAVYADDILSIGGVKLYDTDESHTLQLKWNEDDAANRILNLLVSAADRSITLGGNLVLDGNNQVAAWTISARAGLTIRGSVPFDDEPSGTLKLQNIDSLDATTEATIEAAIDTLANLISIGNQTGIFYATAGTISYKTIGIADNNILEVDGAPADDEYAKFTANGLEGRTYSEVLADLMPASIKTDNYNVLVSDIGKTLVMNGVDKTFSLPSVDAGNVGMILTFVFISTGTLTIDAADNDTIDDSGAGFGIYCTQNGEKYSTITLMLASATEWIILAAKGIWTTTD